VFLAIRTSAFQMRFDILFPVNLEWIIFLKILMYQYWNPNECYSKLFDFKQYNLTKVIGLDDLDGYNDFNIIANHFLDYWT